MQKKRGALTFITWPNMFEALSYTFFSGSLTTLIQLQTHSSALCDARDRTTQEEF